MNGAENGIFGMNANLCDIECFTFVSVLDQQLFHVLIFHFPVKTNTIFFVKKMFLSD